MKAVIQAVQPVLGTRDVAASIASFRLLGFELTFQDTPEAPRYAGVVRDGVEVHIQWVDDDLFAYPVDRPVIRFLVSDVDALHAEFVASGGVSPVASDNSPWAVPAITPWGKREFHLRDPDGNSLQFYQLA